MDQIFNELSVSGCYHNVHDARDGMLQVLRLSRGLRALGFKGTIRTTQDFLPRELCRDYSVANWVHDTSVERDERLYFLTVGTRSPFLEEILAVIQEGQNILFESAHNGEPAVGLGVVYLRDSAALSLQGDVRFQNDPVRISVCKLGEDEESILDVEVCNLTTEHQLVSRTDWLRKRIQNNVASGEDLWEKRSELFSSLIWCANTKLQIRTLSGNEYYFHHIVRHLSQIDQSVKQWDGGEYRLQGVNYSRESKSTMQQYGYLREFGCPDGTTRLFELHTKLHGANIRIHFYPNTAGRIAYIGYIGEHLPY